MVTATATRTIRLVLSLPPSANNLFASRTGKLGQPIRIRTDAYSAWLDAEGYRQSWERLGDGRGAPPRWRTRIVAYGLPERRDIDNCVKPVIDLICKMTGLRDDWPHRAVSAERAEGVPGEAPYLAVEIALLGEG